MNLLLQLAFHCHVKKKPDVDGSGSGKIVMMTESSIHISSQDTLSVLYRVTKLLICIPNHAHGSAVSKYRY